MTFHDQKLERILQLLQLQPYWRSKELAKKLGISKSTIQKCLQELHDSGFAERIHGGVRRINLQIAKPIAINERIAKDAWAKELIGTAATDILPESGYVYLDAGTTLLPLAHALAGRCSNKLIFVTNDISIALILAKHNLKHMLLGGSLHPVTQTLSGPVSQYQICKYNFRVCFISANGIDAKGVVSCSLIEEALLKQLAMKQSSQKVLLAASSKWNYQAGAVISKLQSFDVWILDKISARIKAAGSKSKIKLLLAKQKDRSERGKKL